MSLADPYTINQGQAISITAPMPLAAVGGDNPTAFYLHFPLMPDGMRWVFPFTYGFLYPLPVPIDTPFPVRADLTPPDYPPAPPAQLTAANLTAYQADGSPRVYSAGVVVPSRRSSASSAPVELNATVITTLDNPPGAGLPGSPFLVPDTSAFPVGSFVQVFLANGGIGLGFAEVLAVDPGRSLTFQGGTIGDVPIGSLVVRVPFVYLLGSATSIPISGGVSILGSAGVFPAPALLLAGFIIQGAQVVANGGLLTLIGGVVGKKLTLYHLAVDLAAVPAAPDVLIRSTATHAPVHVFTRQVTDRPLYGLQLPVNEGLELLNNTGANISVSSVSVTATQA